MFQLLKTTVILPARRRFGLWSVLRLGVGSAWLADLQDRNRGREHPSLWACKLHCHSILPSFPALYTHTHTHTHTHTLACRHTCMHTHTHSRTHARTHTHTHTALNTHTKTRTPELNIPHNTSTKQIGFSVIVVVCFFQSFVNQKCWLFCHCCSVLFSNFLCVKYERLNSDLLSCSGTDEKTTKALHPESPEHRSMAASSVSKVMTQPHRTRESEHG